MLSETPQAKSRITISLASTRRASAIRTLFFWCSFFLLSFSLFLPATLLDSEGSALLPSLEGSWPQIARQLLAWRDNLDPLRLSAEFTLLLTVWVFLSPAHRARRRRLFHILFAFTYLLALSYAVYENMTLFFYQDEPVFYNQAWLIIDGIPFLFRHLALAPTLLPLGVLLVVLLAAILAALLKLLTADQQLAALGPGSRFLLIALAVLVLASLVINGRAQGSPKSVVSCLTCKMSRNFSSSVAAAAGMDTLKELSLDHAYDYSAYGLLQRPDIYLIFIESYGGVLYSNEWLNDRYVALLAELDVDLRDQGWRSATILSESPSWGGGSWMAYTSALFGLRVDTQPAYDSLLERFAGGGYPHLASTLSDMGYHNGRVTSLSVELDDVSWQQYKDFYGIESWLRHGDLAYDGRHYGWGPAPPDQYVLHAANEILQADPRPLFLFMITQNSHYPWKEIPPLAPDWRALADGSEPDPQPNIGTPKVVPNPIDYLDSIHYELQMLTNFILNDADEDAIFILIGDHQPGYITRKAGGFHTPLHIISRDEEFIASLDAYDFTPGLLATTGSVPGMKHEGLYSLLMRLLIQQYGRGDRRPPPYLPDGFTAIPHPTSTSYVRK